MSGKLDDYFERLKKLEYLFSKSFGLSKGTYKNKRSNWRKEAADMFFLKITLTARAILKLLPNSLYYFDEENYEIWDIPTSALLARTLIINYIIFYYLCIDDISEEEANFRNKLWRFYSEKRREKMLKNSGADSAKMSDTFSKKVAALKNELENDSYFQKLTIKNIQDVSEAAWEKSISLSREDILKSAGIKVSFFNDVYDYLTNYIHSYSFSFDKLRDFETSNDDSIELFKALTEYCTAFLGLSMRDYAKVLPELKSNIDEECWSIIKNWETLLS
jgi:hypothetical protein